MKISVVTPSFNQAEFLEATIRSVVDQNYPEIEYVVIDGGSTDGSLEIIKKYEKRLHYWVSENDSGHANAINKGFSQTSGEIMAWLNSDDMYLPWAFEVVSEIFGTFPDVNWIVGFHSWWNDKGVLTHAERVKKNIYDFLLGEFAWIQQESVFWRRSLWEVAGGHVSENYDFMVDGELWSRFFLHDDIYHVDCILAGYRFHSKNRAKLNLSKCFEEMYDIIERMRTKCPPKVLKNHRILKTLINLKKKPSAYRLESHARRFFAQTFADAEYNSIVYQDGKWIKSRSQFVI